MSTINRWLILATVSSALLLIVLDTTILYTALPRLTHDLAATAAEKLWIVNAYPLVMAGLLPTMGTLGDRFGHKRFFTYGLITFGLASLIAAFSPDPTILIAARVLLAVGAAMMMPATLSIIRVTFSDAKERALAIGVWSSVSAGGAGLGPIVGGLLLEHYSWGSVFLINLPIVMIAIAATILLVPHTAGNRDKKFDWTGSVQIMIGLVGIVYAIKEITRRGGSTTIALSVFLIGLASLILFIRRQRRSDAPLLDLTLFKNPTFAIGTVTALICSFSLVGIEFVMTQRLQLVLGLTPLQAGLYIVFLPIASFITGIGAGFLLNRFHALNIQWVSLLIAAIGIGGYLMFYQSNYVLQIICLMLIGAGLGSGMTAASSAIMDNAPSHKSGMAASIEEVSFELGGASGIAILGSLSSFIYTMSMRIPSDIQAPLTVKDSIDEALLASEHMTEQAATVLKAAATAAFDNSFVIVLFVGAMLTLITGIVIRIVSYISKRQ